MHHQDKLDLVKASPATVAAHDRSGWMDLFALYAMVEDPVGGAPHHSGGFDRRSGRRGHTVLGRFYDTYIAPNQVRFAVDHDLVCGEVVLRDLTVHVQMSAKVIAQVPMHLQYELVQEEGRGWRIRRLAAHWEVLPMILQVLGKGPAGWQVLTTFGLRVLRLQGLTGMLGFSLAFLHAGRRGKALVQRFFALAEEGNAAALAGLFCDNHDGIHQPSGRTDPAAFRPEQTLRISKLLVAGQVVSCSLKQGDRPGIGLFEFDRRSRRLHRVRLFFQDQGPHSGV